MGFSYDAELWRHNRVLQRACAVRPGERVLDIGCGAGLTTREAAHAESVLGVDVNATAVERARELAEGLANVAFEVGDVQRHPFPAGGFDLAMSRYGTMFFDDPVAAFGNIGRALRPGGRLVMLVWQAGEDNEWSATVRRIFPVEAGPDAFSLADPAVVRSVLEAAGFDDVSLTGVAEPVYYGPDIDTAYDWILGFSTVSSAMARMDPDSAADAAGRLRSALAGHLGDEGVLFGSRSWLVTARRG